MPLLLLSFSVSLCTFSIIFVFLNKSINFRCHQNAFIFVNVYFNETGKQYTHINLLKKNKKLQFSRNLSTFRKHNIFKHTI